MEWKIKGESDLSLVKYLFFSPVWNKVKRVTLIQKPTAFSGLQPGCHWLNFLCPGKRFLFEGCIVTVPSPEWSKDLWACVGIPFPSPDSYKDIYFPIPEFSKDLRESLLNPSQARTFAEMFTSPARNFPRIFWESLAYPFPARTFTEMFTSPARNFPRIFFDIPVPSPELNRDF